MKSFRNHSSELLEKMVIMPENELMKLIKQLVSSRSVNPDEAGEIVDGSATGWRDPLAWQWELVEIFKIKKLAQTLKKALDSVKMKQLLMLSFLVAFLTCMGQLRDMSFVQIAYMVIVSFMSYQLFEITCQITEMTILMNKISGSLSHVEASLSLTCGS